MLISRALDGDNYALMASIDLSAAFDVINIGLLIKPLKIIGLLEDVVSLIEVWLRNKVFYVEIDDLVSNINNINHDTIQGQFLDLSYIQFMSRPYLTLQTFQTLPMTALP